MVFLSRFGSVFDGFGMIRDDGYESVGDGDVVNRRIGCSGLSGILGGLGVVRCNV